jgi:hypothetical protein
LSRSWSLPSADALPSGVIRVVVITKGAYALLAGFHPERNVKMGFPTPDDPSNDNLSPL